jgi:hypothetical protein
VEQLDKDTLEVINVYPSVSEAARQMGCVKFAIQQAIQKQACSKGYR